MRALTTFLATLALTLAACGGSDSNPATDAGTGTKADTAPTTTGSGRSPATQGRCPTASNTATCAELTTYQTCQATKCLTELKKAMGEGFATGNYEGGSCGPMLTCMMACPCDATASTCEAGCAALMGNCMTDIGAMSACASTNCGLQPTCTGTTPPTVGANCTAAVACCKVVTATPTGAAYQGLCANLASATEEGCTQALAGMKSMCP